MIGGLRHLDGPVASTRLRDLVPEPDVGHGEQVDVGRVGGLERGEAGGLPLRLTRGVAAGCHEAQYPAGRVGPGGSEGGAGPVDQPGAVLRYQHVVRRPV
jgi:hypothetical protein